MVDFWRLSLFSGCYLKKYYSPKQLFYAKTQNVGVKNFARKIFFVVKNETLNKDRIYCRMFYKMIVVIYFEESKNIYLAFAPKITIRQKKSANSSKCSCNKKLISGYVYDELKNQKFENINFENFRNYDSRIIRNFQRKLSRLHFSHSLNLEWSSKSVSDETSLSSPSITVTCDHLLTWNHLIRTVT